MTDNSEQPENGSSCGGDGGCCGRSSRLWIWLALVGAIVGVMIARNSGKKDVAQGTSVQAVAPVAVTEAVGAAAVPAPDAVATEEGMPEVADPVLPVTGLPRMVDLGAGACIPCKAMKPILDDCRANYADFFRTEFIDVWENPDEAGKYGINLIPTQIFYDAAGTELFRHEGFYGKEDILAKWQEFGVDVTAKGK
jgi:thioredoxin 1